MSPRPQDAAVILQGWRRHSSLGVGTLRLPQHALLTAFCWSRDHVLTCPGSALPPYSSAPVTLLAYSHVYSCFSSCSPSPPFFPTPNKLQSQSPRVSGVPTACLLQASSYTMCHSLIPPPPGQSFLRPTQVAELSSIFCHDTALTPS